MGFAKLPLIVAVLPLPLQPQMVTGGVCEALVYCQLSASMAGFAYIMISNGIDAGVGLLRACKPNSVLLHVEHSSSPLPPTTMDSNNFDTMSGSQAIVLSRSQGPHGCHLRPANRLTADLELHCPARRQT
jgi:hypothetical protein